MAALHPRRSTRRSSSGSCVDGQQARLTQAALETLAVVAYRQPVTRARVSAVRGVNVDGVMRTLIGRGLVPRLGTTPRAGAILYGPPTLFLERLGLTVRSTSLPRLWQTYLPDIELLDATVIDANASSSEVETDRWTRQR